MDFSKAALKVAGAFILAGSIATFAGCQNNKCADKDGCCGSCSTAGACKEKCSDKGECKDGEKKQALNTTCPIGDHAADGTITASHNGKTVAFCCNDCKEAFATKTDAEKVEIIAKAYAAK